jgi:hypothetical protein
MFDHAGNLYGGEEVVSSICFPCLVVPLSTETYDQQAFMYDPSNGCDRHGKVEVHGSCDWEACRDWPWSRQM